MTTRLRVVPAVTVAWAVDAFTALMPPTPPKPTVVVDMSFSPEYAARKPSFSIGNSIISVSRALTAIELVADFIIFGSSSWLQLNQNPSPFDDAAIALPSLLLPQPTWFDESGDGV